MADWKNVAADGVASKARIMLAPLLCPARVIFEILPPKLGKILRKNFSEAIISCTAKFVRPSGELKPS